MPDAPYLFISEVLAAPPAGATGDANRDGRRHAYEDEFVELFNAGPDTLDLHGMRLGDDDTDAGAWFVFPPDARLAPGAYALLFGGGQPAGFDALTFVDDGRIGNGLSNAGDALFLIGATGALLDSLGPTQSTDAPWPQGRSLYREAPTAAWQAHPHAPFSPGASSSPTPPPAPADPPETPSIPLPHPPAAPPNTPPHFESSPPKDARASYLWRYPVRTRDDDGDSTSLVLQQAPPWITLADTQNDAPVLIGTPPDGPPQSFYVRLLVTDGIDTALQHFSLNRLPRPDLILDEILAAPCPDPACDANGDGRSARYEDEFVEVLNRGAAIDLSGCTLSDDDAQENGRFRFPTGTYLANGDRLVLFGGGTPTGISGRVFADDGRIGNGLSNGNDRVLLLCAADTLIDHAYTQSGRAALTHQTDGGYLPHNTLPGRLLFSPGQAQTRYQNFSLDPLTLTTGIDSPPPILRGHWSNDSAPLRQTYWAARDSLPPGTTILPDTAFFWSSADTTRLGLGRNGLLRPLRPGPVILSAWSGGYQLAAREVNIRQAPTSANRPPSFSADPDTRVFAGAVYQHLCPAVDPEDDTLHYTLAAGPPWLRLEQHTGLLSGQAPDLPPGSAAQAADVKIEAHDGRGGLARLAFTLRVVPYPNLHISEVLTDPPDGIAGDANGDGRRDPFEDEFVEIHNAGPHAFDLRGCRLSAGGDSFVFPAVTLSPGAYAVVFGGGVADTAALRFNAGGRLGRGLHNRQGRIALVHGKADTLALASYNLKSDANRSLIWPATAPTDRKGAPPDLHGRFPQRALFSPGKPTPSLIDLRPISPARTLDIGDSLNAPFEASYSDGAVLRVHMLQDAPWHWVSDDTTVAQVRAGRLIARGAGQTTLSLFSDSLSASINLNVRPPLAANLRFSPSWTEGRRRSGTPMAFSVATPPGLEALYTWRLNGRPLRTHSPHYLYRARLAGTDTLEVEIRTRSRGHTHRWLIHPPQVASAWPNPFNPETSVSFHLESPQRVRLDLYSVTGQHLRTLVDGPLAAGRHRYRWDGRDAHGRPAASGVYFFRLYRERSPASAFTGKLLLLR